MWLMSTNIPFLSFFLFHAPPFILLLYRTFEMKSHINETHFIPFAPYAICEMLLPLWFSLVLVQLYADWLSRPPADPALILPPISFNKLTQAQTWDNSSYSVPSAGDSDNGRWLCTSSSMFSLMSQYWAVCSVQPEIACVHLHAWYVRERMRKLEREARKVACGLFSSQLSNYSLIISTILGLAKTWHSFLS